MIDLDAEIVPGTSAAGFAIGERYSERELGEATIWDKAKSPLGIAISSTEGWLRVNMTDSAPAGPLGHVLYYRHGAVKLLFSPNGILYNIGVFAGYLGKFSGVIGIGDRLDSVRQYMNLSFDSGDEMNYPEDGSDVHGIAFLGSFTPLDEDEDQLISGISVHDWSLMKS